MNPRKQSVPDSRLKTQAEIQTNVLFRLSPEYPNSSLNLFHKITNFIPALGTGVVMVQQNQILRHFQEFYFAIFPGHCMNIKKQKCNKTTNIISLSYTQFTYAKHGGVSIF